MHFQLAGMGLEFTTLSTSEGLPPLEVAKLLTTEKNSAGVPKAYGLAGSRAVSSQSA